MSFDMLADHRKFCVLTSREPEQFSLASFRIPKHLLQTKCSVDHGPNLHVCLMLAFGVTYAQHRRATHRYAPPPETESCVVNDRILNTAILHELPTGMKRRLFPITVSPALDICQRLV
jgi:hypothetical protein